MKIKLVPVLVFIIFTIFTASCNSNNAGSYKSVSDCRELSNTDEKTVCYRAIFDNGGDVSLCRYDTFPKTAEEVFDVTSCLNAFVAISAEKSDYKDVNECVLLSVEREEKAMMEKKICYLSVAKKSKDVSVCEKITTNEKDEKCYPAFAIVGGETEDISICDGISDSSTINSKDNCYEAIAKAKSDPSLCEKMRYPNGCLYRIALSTKDEKVCDRISLKGFITAVYTTDSCYLEIAKAKNDITICESLPEESSIELCKEKYNN